MMTDAIKLAVRETGRKKQISTGQCLSEGNKRKMSLGERLFLKIEG